VCGCGCVEDDAYDRDPGWLEDLETDAAIGNLREAAQASATYDDTGISTSSLPLTRLYRNQPVFIDQCCDAPWWQRPTKPGAIPYGHTSLVRLVYVLG